ncbi:hypothetical protein PPERSA_09087 [Pseudocohnilembus persalinus]|uniref:Uncharacterized protein n=1 Tax=Pseudocohnilembus persalinus TaxID=266149 RepID=A0A0V0Q7C8_PSEPJ|nr:hypothetical protein PPERSA_09087 [Pseudocohnilembus persalinus]|eukprot:KRW98147.1 hypothetical protein PPERSA_09087 [Pseudocohnilembus persalinus]
MKQLEIKVGLIYKIQLMMRAISDGTGIKEGMTGSFLDYDNEKILMFEFGNLLDSSNQETIQANLYQIGSIKLNDKDDDEGNAFIIGFKTIAVIFVALVLL